MSEVPNNSFYIFNAENLHEFENACERIGSWLSAALEDPSTCTEFKNDIKLWFEHTPF